MGWLDRILGDDRQRAKTQYAGRESASDSAARSRRNGHRNRGAARAARRGQDWETADRDRETGRRTPR
ncbi:hypothetical protein [Streptomyces aureus]|uniref:hypothetical protein n=1 Tax=Streptomyces aureus TaxID=193461 RepID=UPI000567943C|nr:hypothetical protein [Streptomyces aureus]